LPTTIIHFKQGAFIPEEMRPEVLKTLRTQEYQIVQDEEIQGEDGGPRLSSTIPPASFFNHNSK
jgi:hypothetical protein